MIDYQIHEVSENQIKIAQWYLNHKKQIVKIPIILLAIFSIGTLLYGAVGIVSFLVKTSKEDTMLARMTINVLDFAGYKLRTQPIDLIITDPQVLYNGNQSYDFIAQVKNPNERRGVMKLTYQFFSADYQTAENSIVILPKQTVYLLSLGNKSEKRLSQAGLKIISIQWQSLLRKDLPEVSIATSEPAFGSLPDSSRSWVSFQATNNSLLNIWDVNFQAILYSGRRVVGANQITTEQFAAGETREMEMSWFERLPKVTQIDIVPMVDIYTPDSFYLSPGEAGNLP